LVGRDRSGAPLCLVVKNVLMTDCVQGAASLVVKATRSDLIQSFIQSEGDVEFINFPDLPGDVAELLSSGRSLPILDTADDMRIDCVVDVSDAITKVAAR